MTDEENERMTELIDLAVECWHMVADDHGGQHCNCFREKFVQTLIDRKMFDGYQRVGRKHEISNRIRPAPRK